MGEAHSTLLVFTKQGFHAVFCSLTKPCPACGLYRPLQLQVPRLCSVSGFCLQPFVTRPAGPVPLQILHDQTTLVREEAWSHEYAQVTVISETAAVGKVLKVLHSNTVLIAHPKKMVKKVILVKHSRLQRNHHRYVICWS